MSESSSRPAGALTGLAGLMVSAKPDDSAVIVFKDGQITAEWEAEDGKKTSDLGAYEVSGGKVFINGFMTEPKLEGKTLTLTELTSSTKESVSKQEDNEPSMIELTEGVFMVLEKK